MRTLLTFLAVVGFGAAAPAISSAQAPASLDPQWAGQFIGAWDVTLDTPDGRVPLVLTVREDGGKVVVALGNGQGEADPITDVTRSGEALVAAYEMEYQGMTIDATIRMQREGESLRTNWSFAGGSYETSAQGTRR